MGFEREQHLELRGKPVGGDHRQARLRLQHRPGQPLDRDQLADRGQRREVHPAPQAGGDLLRRDAAQRRRRRRQHHPVGQGRPQPRASRRWDCSPRSTSSRRRPSTADTVEVDFSKPTLGFIPTLGYHGSILLSPKTLALSVNQQANLTNEIGSGPFVVKSFQTGRQLHAGAARGLRLGAARPRPHRAGLPRLDHLQGGGGRVDPRAGGRRRRRAGRLQRHPVGHPVAGVAGLHRRDAALPGLRRRLRGRRRSAAPTSQPATCDRPCSTPSTEPRS